MNITEEVLQLMGADREGDEWVIHCSGVHIRIKPRVTKGKQIKCNDGSLLWDMDGHHVSSLEEMLAFAYLDGLRDGRNQLRNDLKELLTEE